MVRSAFALALIAACGGARPAATTGQGEEAGSGSGEVASPLARKVAVSWGIEGHGSSADVFLATTDETGKQVSHPVGSYPGTCAVIAPAREMNAVSGVACRNGATGIELHAVIENGVDIVVLKLRTDEGVRQDPMAREEVARVKVPAGAKIEGG
jgi:hypothetical protein